jgi:hypothetical protein
MNELIKYLKSPAFWVGVIGIPLLKNANISNINCIMLILSIIVIIMLVLKHFVFDKQNNNHEKGWYKTITKYIVLLYGISISTLLISLINIDLIKNHITNEFNITGEYFIFKWWMQIIESLIIIVVCWGLNWFLKVLRKLGLNIKEYRKYPELKQRYITLLQQNRELQDDNDKYANRIKSLEKEKCKHSNCEKYKVVLNLLEYKKEIQDHE